MSSPSEETATVWATPGTLVAKLLTSQFRSWASGLSWVTLTPSPRSRLLLAGRSHVLPFVGPGEATAARLPTTLDALPVTGQQPPYRLGCPVLRWRSRQFHRSRRRRWYRCRRAGRDGQRRPAGGRRRRGCRGPGDELRLGNPDGQAGPGEAACRGLRGQFG